MLTVVVPHFIPLEKYKKAEAVEIRLDFFSQKDLFQLKTYRKKIIQPLIFTYKGKITSQKEKETLFSWLQLKPDYCDVDYSICPFFLEECKKAFPKVQWIFSFHHFSKTPLDLFSYYRTMKEKGADICKIACQVNSPLDAMRLFSFARSLPQKDHIVVGMGRKGRWLRACSFLLGNAFHFVAVDSSCRKYGQYTLEEWIQKGFSSLEYNTSLYALLGNPVSQSKGDLFHNDYFQRNQKRAFYIKIALQEEELFPFLEEAKKLPFQGFSITMPLKEKAYAYCKKEQAVQAKISVNTLVKKKGGFWGYNTDITSIVELLQEKSEVTFLILGTGATAKELGFYLQQKGKKVVFLGRSHEKLQKLQKKGFETSFFSEKKSFPESCVCIQCTSVGMDRTSCVVTPDFFKPDWLILEVIYVPKKTPFLQIGKKRGCKTIDGTQLFFKQAQKQQIIWQEAQK